MVELKTNSERVRQWDECRKTQTGISDITHFAFIGFIELSYMMESIKAECISCFILVPVILHFAPLLSKLYSVLLVCAFDSNIE